LKKIEAEYAECRNTVARVTAQLEIENSKVAEKQKEIEKLNGQLEALTLEHEKYVNEAKLNESKLLKTISELKEKEELLNKEIEKFKKLKEMERLELYRPNKATMPPSPNASPSPSNNTAPSLPATPTSPSAPPALQTSSSGNKLDILAFPNSGSSHIPALEKLQTTLRQKEGEIASLQAQISNLEKTKGDPVMSHSQY
jgi:TolA-binding protein